MKCSDGSSLRLYRQTIQDFTLYSGRELSEEEWLNLQQAASQMSAKMRAVRIVSMSSVSKGDLEQRLIQKGEDPQQAHQAVQWMADMELLDDRKTAQQIVNRCAQKGYGISRAKQALYEKRIPKQYWDDALEDYPDQQEHILVFLQSRITQNCDPKDIRKAVDALIRRGHSYQLIRRCLQQMNATLED